MANAFAKEKKGRAVAEPNKETVRLNADVELPVKKNLEAFCLQASEQLRMSRVTTTAVIKILLKRLETDEAFRKSVIEELRK
jgi:hypothetical protein